MLTTILSPKPDQKFWNISFWILPGPTELWILFALSLAPRHLTQRLLAWYFLCRNRYLAIEALLSCFCGVIIRSGSNTSVNYFHLYNQLWLPFIGYFPASTIHVKKGVETLSALITEKHYKAALPLQSVSGFLAIFVNLPEPSMPFPTESLVSVSSFAEARSSSIRGL